MAYNSAAYISAVEDLIPFYRGFRHVLIVWPLTIIKTFSSNHLDNSTI
jgi:hypothetical protein